MMGNITGRRVFSFAVLAGLFAFVTMLSGAAEAQSRLKDCPKDQTKRYHNCFGTYKNADGFKYVGEFQNDKYEGQGTATYASGDKYVGEFRNNKREGQGTFTFANGNKYVGEFRNDKLEGQGTYTFASGNKYVGEFKNGKREGKGTFTYASGETYVGDFKDDKYNGRGTLTYPAGSAYTSYVGEFRAGERSGQGMLTFADGNKYAGEFKNDMREGQGIFTFADGDQYIGESKANKFDGQGSVTFNNGDKYVGGFKNSEREGQGTYFSADGRKVVGQFARNELNGPAVKYLSDGTIIEQGIYKDGDFIETAIVDPTLVQVPQSSATQNIQPAPAAQVSTQKKVALVIGNGGYQHATRLANPGNDAAAMSAMLRSLGFEVVSGSDLGKQQMEGKMREFVGLARQADVTLFFYSGHGIQVDGQNYLVPVDAAVSDPSAVDFELVNVSLVSNYLGGGNQVGIVLLDACRDNPFTKTLAALQGNKSTQVSRGLAPVQAQAGGLLVGFATAPGDVAADGEGMKNSPFTTALLKYLPTKGLEVELLMKRVKAEVYNLTNTRQSPWHNSDLRTEVYLAGQTP